MSFGRTILMGLALLVLLLLFALFQGAISSRNDEAATSALLSVVATAEFIDCEFEFCQEPIEISSYGRKIKYQHGKVAKELFVRPRRDGLFELIVDGKAMGNILLRDALFEQFKGKKGKTHSLRFTFWGTDDDCETALPFVVVKSLQSAELEVSHD